MGIVFKQEYNDIYGKKTIRDFNLDLEMICLDQSDLSSKITIKCEHHSGNEKIKNTIDASSLIYELLEAKRTNVPKWITLTRLSKKANQGDSVLYIDPFDTKIGNPIAIASNINGLNITYNIIKYINDDSIELMYPITNNYYVGAFVQDLSNGWWKGYHKLGHKSSLTTPHSIYFDVETKNNIIDVLILTPINSGIINGYDVYVRNKSFSKIEHHWVPDMSNIDVFADRVSIKTYNGGESAGGGNLTNGIYYIALISKDKLSYYNVNESECIVKQVNLQY